jgi:type I pantothenate kinase
MLRGLNEPVSITDVAEIFLPLSRPLNLHVLAKMCENPDIAHCFCI